MQLCSSPLGSTSLTVAGEHIVVHSAAKETDNSPEVLLETNTEPNREQTLAKTRLLMNTNVGVRLRDVH